MFELIAKIEKTRSRLQNLLMQKNNLLDNDVLSVSQELDMLLNKYYQIIAA